MRNGSIRQTSLVAWGETPMIRMRLPSNHKTTLDHEDQDFLPDE
jgi:hypothetical protein